MKVELDVKLLLCGQEILAEAGDRLMVYGEQVIGVLPKGEASRQGLGMQEAVSRNLAARAVTVDAVIEGLQKAGPAGVNLRQLGNQLGFASDDTLTRARLRAMVLALVKEYTAQKHPEDSAQRYPRYRMAALRLAEAG